MDGLLQVLKFFHVLTMVFMSAPMYSLVIVNERALFSAKMIYQVDRYIENIMKKQAMRCYIFQFTVLITGLALVYFNGMGLMSIITNWVLLAKLILVLLLIALLSVVHFNIQPKIEEQLAKISSDPIPDEIAGKIKIQRIKRKKLAAFCLFIVLITIILGLQVFVRYNLILNVLLFVFAVLFAYRAFKAPVPFGWF
jgi:hypothetical protein